VIVSEVVSMISNEGGFKRRNKNRMGSCSRKSKGAVQSRKVRGRQYSLCRLREKAQQVFPAHRGLTARTSCTFVSRPAGA
jgi:hypothetical protein